jgi:hypothetical protein
MKSPNILVIYNMLGDWYFKCFFDLGLDNEWSPFEHSSSFWHISVCHDLCPRLVCFCI